MATDESLPRRIAEVARSLQAESGSKDTMDLAVRLAVEVIDGAEDAAISLVHRRRRAIETPAAAGERGIKVDQIQHELGEGPSIMALGDEEVVSCPDVASESRWGEWGPRTAQVTGVRSMMCFRLFTRNEVIGALSVYSTRPHAFSDAGVESGMSFAAHAAIAIAVAQQDEHMEIALDSRAMIGQATGILMARYDLDAVRAFAALARISQHSNVKLHQVAADVIRTRHLPA